MAIIGFIVLGLAPAFGRVSVLVFKFCAAAAAAAGGGRDRRVNVGVSSTHRKKRSFCTSVSPKINCDLVLGISN